MTAYSGKILLLLILLSLSAFFSCSETVFFSLTRAQLNRLKNSPKSYARHVIKILQNPRDVLITILMGNEFVNVAFAVLMASLVYNIAGHVDWKISALISILIATPVVLLFGEVIPKNIAVRSPMALTPVLIVPLRLFSRLFYPVRILLTKFADRMVLFFGGDPGQVRSMIMEEEFRQLVELGLKEGELQEGESDLIHRLFDLGNKTVAEIMTPQEEIFRLSLDSPLDNIFQEMRDVQFNRVPVYRKDHDDIIGTLHSRDVFRLYRNCQKGCAQNLEEIVRPIHSVHMDESIEDLLTDLQQLKVHMAVVLNKKKKVVGLVTMDDIFKLLFTEKLEGKKVG